MSRLLIGIAAATCAIAIFLFTTNFQLIQLQPEKDSRHSTDTHQKHKNGANQLMEKHSKPDSTIKKNHHNKEAGFDFSTYVNQEMADEIRPYTSRSQDGLHIKVDSDGHEYVDLKKRWSHATISVVDENGEKHTGEWAPEN